MNSRFYLPILKSKLGEFQALARLDESVKDHIVPLFEITPIEWDFATRTKPTTIEEHLAKFANKMGKHWKRNNCFIDTYLINATEIAGTSCIELTFNLLNKYDIRPMPVLHLHSPDDFSRGIKGIVDELKIQHFGVRVKPDDITSPDFERDLGQLLSEFSIEASDCNLIFDLEDADFSNIEDISDSVINILEYFPRFNDWITFTICGSAFPSSAQIKGPEAKIYRNDWKFYKRLVSKLSGNTFNRFINYGDYSIVNPQYFEFNPKTMSSSANIRYTHDEIWYVQKGKALKKAEDWKQYKQQAKAIMKSGYFLGEAFSAGDLHFSKCVKGEVSPGSPTVWNWVGNNHHFTKVVADLLSSHYGV